MSRTTLFKIIAVLLGFLVAGSIAEFSVKAITPQMTGEVVYGYDPVLGAIPLPNQRGRKTPPHGPSYEFSNNSYGFRGSREYGLKEPGKARVLFLGDSFTYGVGINDDQTFPDQVEKILRGRRYPVECINAGNPGAGTDYELRLLQTLGPKLKPDLVVVCFYWNDFYDNADGEYFILGKNGELIPQAPHSLDAKKARIENLPIISWLLSWSNAANLIRAAMVEFVTRSRRQVSETKYKPEAPKRDLRITKVLFEQIIKTAKAQGSEVLFFYLPDEPQIRGYRQTGKIPEYEEEFQNLLIAEHQEPYSLTRTLAAMTEKIALPFWGHWSPAANLTAARYMSGIIAEWLTKNQLGPQGSRASRQDGLGPSGVAASRLQN